MVNHAAVSALLAAGVCAAVAGCEAVVGITDRQVASRDASVSQDASPDAALPTTPEPEAGSGDAAAEASCTHAVPPGPTALNDGTLNVTAQLAVNLVNLGAAYPAPDAGLPPLGFDLDGVCTCPGPSSCTPVNPSSRECDLEGGRDSSLELLLEQFALSAGGAFQPSVYTTALKQGLYGLMLRISGYNGGANDTEVNVGIFTSNGTYASDGGVPPIPKWDGTDVWTIDTSSNLSGTDAGSQSTPVVFDTAAYVTNHVLVAHPSPSPFEFRIYGGALFGGITLHLEDVVVTGQLVMNADGGVSITEGTIAGRWPVKYLSSALAEQPSTNSATGGFLCPGNPQYSLVKVIVCGLADISWDQASTTPTATCDALSAGFGFTAVPGLMGPTTSRAPSASPCLGAPATESCP